MQMTNSLSPPVFKVLLRSSWLSIFPYILVLYETNLEDSIDSSKFSVSGYFHLIRKDSITHIHGPAVNVRKGISLTQELLFPGKIATTVFGLKIEFKEKMQGFFSFCRSKNAAGDLNFEI